MVYVIEKEDISPARLLHQKQSPNELSTAQGSSGRLEDPSTYQMPLVHPMLDLAISNGMYDVRWRALTHQNQTQPRFHLLDREPSHSSLPCTARQRPPIDCDKAKPDPATDNHLERGNRSLRSFHGQGPCAPGTL